MEDLAPVLVTGLLMLWPIMKLLIGHQQKMAELIHRTNQQPATAEFQQLQSDMQQLKNLVHQQAIAIDNLSSKLDDKKVQERLSQVAS